MTPETPLPETSTVTSTVVTNKVNAEEVGQESQLFSISIRAWLALIIVVTVCVISMVAALHTLKAGDVLVIQEPLYSMAVLALGFYFGQKTGNKA